MEIPRHRLATPDKDKPPTGTSAQMRRGGSLKRQRPGLSINDLAEKAGVAPATVSRALNGYADIADATRQRILKLADELNYQPSARARQLARGRVETIGFVLPINNRYSNDPFLSDFLDALAAALATRDHDLLVATTREGEPEVEVYKRLVAAGKCEGFIVTNSRDDDPRISTLQELQVPFVVYGRAASKVPYAYLDMDNEAALAGMVDHLIALGHRRLAYLDLDDDATFARLRRAGFEKGVDRSELQPGDVAMVRVAHTSAGGREGVARLFDGGDSHQPTAIVCPADVVAIGAIQAVSSRGYHVGRDVSVTGYDGVPLGAYIAPPLTTMSQPTRDIGRRLVDILFRVMDGADPAQFSEVLMPNLVRRSSDGSPTLIDGATSQS